jgi:hypothetical protein
MTRVHPAAAAAAARWAISARWMPRPRASGRTAPPPSQPTRRCVCVAATAHDPSVELGDELVIAVGPGESRLEPAPRLGDRRFRFVRRCEDVDPGGLVGRLDGSDDEALDGRRGATSSTSATCTLTRASSTAPASIAGVPRVDEPAGRAGIAEEPEGLVHGDRNDAQSERAVELRAREVRRRGRRQVAVVDDPDVVALAAAGSPHPEPGLAVDVVEEVEQVEDRRRESSAAARP